MKKLFLLALLLGLTGCGDNNQDDTSQANAQTPVEQTALAAPVAANYSLAATPRAMTATALPLGGWTGINLTPLGASSIWDAAKGTSVSAALITPNAAEVAKVLRGGAAGIALSIAVDQLLGAVDWILDPANSLIRYRLNSDEAKFVYRLHAPPYYNSDSYFRKTKAEVITDFYEYISRLNSTSSVKFVFSDANVVQINKEFFEIRYNGYLQRPDGSQYNNCNRTSTGYCTQYLTVKPATPEEKTLPLETVAEQVISNADADSLDAQVATGLAAQNILNEAYNDDAKAEPIVNDLERNSKKCPDGRSRNVYGQCFICGSAAVESKMAEDVQIAKGAHIGLGACKATHTFEGLMLRYNNYVREATARDKLNACYDVPHQPHLDQAREAWRQAEEVCVGYMASK